MKLKPVNGIHGASGLQLDRLVGNPVGIGAETASVERKKAQLSNVVVATQETNKLWFNQSVIYHQNILNPVISAT